MIENLETNQQNCNAFISMTNYTVIMQHKQLAYLYGGNLKIKDKDRSFNRNKNTYSWTKFSLFLSYHEKKLHSQVLS